MKVMNISAKHTLLIVSMLIAVTTSCATVKTVNVWKDKNSHEPLEKVLVIAVAELDYMQRHFENVLCESLASRGIEAVAANKVFPQSSTKLDRAAIASKVRELGVKYVLVARSVSKEETSRLYQGGVYVVPAGYSGGWYGFYSGSVGAVPSLPGAYDAELITVITNIYAADSEKLIWSSVTSVKVENSREGALNPLIDRLIRQMEESKII
jgi:hypothetical protein